jgi:hypothetical protein
MDARIFALDKRRCEQVTVACKHLPEFEREKWIREDAMAWFIGVKHGATTDRPLNETIPLWAIEGNHSCS